MKTARFAEYGEWPMPAPLSAARISDVEPLSRTQRPFGTLAIDDAVVRLEGGVAASLRLRVPAAARVAGGPIDLLLVVGGRVFAGESIQWLVTTNRGWAHFRGAGRWTDGPAVAFRCDLFSARADGSDDNDLFALRVYAPGTDPERDGPLDKVSGTMPPGSVRLGS